MQNALRWTYFQTTYYCVWGGEGVGREQGRRRLPGGNFYQMSGYAVCQKCKNTAYFTHKKTSLWTFNFQTHNSDKFWTKNSDTFMKHS